MNDAPHDLSEPRRASPPISAALVAKLRASDAETWHSFLVDHHAVFARSLRLAVLRAPAHGLDAGDPSLIDDAKAYFYQAFLRSFVEYRQEGQFFAFLHRTVSNFVAEQRRRARRAAANPLDDDDDDAGAVADHAAAAWGRTRQQQLDPGLEAQLDRCLLRLPAIYRSVVLLRHFETPGEPLDRLAATLGATIEAIHKRYQRALAMLRECLGGFRPESIDAC